MVEMITQQTCTCCGKKFSATHSDKIIDAQPRDYVSPVVNAGGLAGALVGATMVYKTRDVNNIGTGFKLGCGMLVGALIMSCVGEVVARPLGWLMQNTLPQPKPELLYCCKDCEAFYQTHSDE